MHATRLGKFAPLLLLAALTVLLTACPGVSGGGGNGGAPQISSFTPSQNNVASGTPVTLNWVITGVPTSLSISGSDGTSLSSLIGTNTTVTPTTTTTYTLTATNSSGSDTETTTVTVGGTGPVTPPTDGSRTLSFGVSSTQDGTFQSDANGGITAGDPRIVNVPASGGTFYAQVTYSGPAPVTGITIFIANRSPEGLPVRPFPRHQCQRFHSAGGNDRMRFRRYPNLSDLYLSNYGSSRYAKHHELTGCSG